MRTLEESTRAKALAQGLIAAYGKGASVIALAIVATLIDNGLIDYAQLWQQVANLIGGNS